MYDPKKNLKGNFTQSIFFFFIMYVESSVLLLSCVQLCDPKSPDSLDCSMPGFPVYHQVPELAQTHVHRVDDAIQPPHPLSLPSPPAFNLFQHQCLFKGVSFSESVGQSVGVSASVSVLPMNIQD